MMTDAELYKIAENAAEGAYAPYSGYKVGAALLAKDGKVYTGVNIENSSFGATICAERTAAVKAISDGHRSFKALAVAAPGTGAPSWPCGMCRQFLFEFGGEIRVITGKNSDTIEVHTLNELFVHGFLLQNEKVKDD
jgi:cytidine deaminase